MNISGTILQDYAKQSGEDYVVLNIALVDDGYGGQKYEVTEGLHFEGVTVLSTSITGEIAKAQGVTGLYTLAYPKNFTLPPKTVIRRLKDGKLFRTTELDGNATPEISSLNMKVTRLEDFTLPNGTIQ